MRNGGNAEASGAALHRYWCEKMYIIMMIFL